MSDPRGDTEPVEILCPECDYNLHALTCDRCPWCGWKIDAGVLIEEAQSNPASRRISAGLTALLVSGLTLAALGALIVRARQLTLFDVIAVVGVGLAAVGHFVLGFNVLTCGRRFRQAKNLAAPKPSTPRRSGGAWQNAMSRSSNSSRMRAPSAASSTTLMIMPQRNSNYLEHKFGKFGTIMSSVGLAQTAHRLEIIQNCGSIRAVH